jgi:hypothetical protein
LQEKQQKAQDQENNARSKPGNNRFFHVCILMG